MSEPDGHCQVTFCWPGAPRVNTAFGAQKMPVRPVVSTSWALPAIEITLWSNRTVTERSATFLLALTGSGPVVQPRANAFALSPAGRPFGGTCWPSLAETAAAVPVHSAVGACAAGGAPWVLEQST